MVQLPLPKHIDEAAVLKRIRVEKDADGFSAANIGNMCLRGGDPPLALPCTPAGCIELIKRSGVDVSGKDAVVLGRSNIEQHMPWMNPGFRYRHHCCRGSCA